MSVSFKAKFGIWSKDLNKTASSSLLMGLFLLFALARTTIAAAAGPDTCAGINATIGGTCTPLENTTSGSTLNTAFGGNTLTSNTIGTDNTAIGVFALQSNTTGSANTAIGVLALQSNTMSVGNTATGVSALQNNTTGDTNTATGGGALAQNTAGNNNTATGVGALGGNTTGSDNTAAGVQALENNETGGENTASGDSALEYNTTGNYNTASGFKTLENNITGSANTASGFEALYENTGSNNTASGFAALFSNTSGIDETAIGSQALQNNTTGAYNTAAGFHALAANNTGTLGTAIGVNALLANTYGQQNTAVGVNAMLKNTNGSNNIALGYQAGINLTTGSNNVDIGNPGVGAESNTIRIGTQRTDQGSTYISGIFGSLVTGDPVMVSSTGKLGIVMSSARYKRDIQDMGTRSDGLLKLRPVTFYYKNDHGGALQYGALQYGLVAEEVARVYPELVSYGPDGKPMTVHYSTLSAMLLNELQKQTRKNDRQAQQIETLTAKVAEVEASTRRALDEQRAAFEQRLSRLEQPTRAKDDNHNLAVAFK